MRHNIRLIIIVVNTRIFKLRRVLKKEKLDAFVVLTQEGNNKNVQYLSNFSGTSGLLVITEKKQILMVDSRYTERARKETRGVIVVQMANSKAIYEYIKQGLEVMGIRGRARVGFEGKNISFLMARKWEKKLPYTLVPTENIVERLRQYKDKEEIAYIRLACQATSMAFRKIAPRVCAGMRESEIALTIDSTLREFGATENSFTTIVASGPNAAIPHHNTSGRRICAGEALVLDFGGVFKGGYVSDLSRTLFVPGKKPDPKFVKIYKAVRGAQRAAKSALRAGLSFKKYDAVARQYIEKAGYGKYFTHSLGHSIGLDAHDPYDYKNDVIKIGTVLTNEPGIYIPGRGGVRIEDDIVITKNGAEQLTGAPYLKF